jgi:hypothetical protein
MTMKWSVRCGMLGVVMAVSAVMAGEPTKEEPNKPTPAKEESKKPAPTTEVPTISFVVASPRAYLAGDAKGGAIDYASMTGAADNFARPARPLVKVIDVPVGARVVFSLDPEAEGVWMHGAHGMIGTLLTLQQLVVKECAECEDRAAADANDASEAKRESKVSVQGRDSNDVAPPADPNDKTRTRTPADPNDTPATRRPAQLARWIPIATDGVRDIRFGPSIGWAKKVSVPVRFEKAGVYCLRGIVCTSVKSWSPRVTKRPTSREVEAAADRSRLPDHLLAVDIDIVHVAVRVADKSAKEGDKKVAPDEDKVLATDMADIAEAEALDLDEDVLNDFGIFVGQQESDFVLPTEN